MDEQRRSCRHAQLVEAAIRGLDRHRQRGRRREVEVCRDASPRVQDRDIGRARDRRPGVVGDAEHALSDGHIRDTGADRVDNAGHLDTDAARKLAREQPPAQCGICRREAACVNEDANATALGLGNLDLVDAKHVGGLAVGVKAKRAGLPGSGHR